MGYMRDLIWRLPFLSTALILLSASALRAQTFDEFSGGVATDQQRLRDADVTSFSVQVGEMVDEMNAAILAMDTSVSQIAIGLLFLLLAVDMVISFGRAVIGQSELSDVLQRFVFRLLFVGLVYFLIENAADVIGWLGDTALGIVDKVTTTTGTSSAAPTLSNIFSESISDAGDLLGEITLTSLSSLLFIFAALIRLVAGAVIGAVLLITYVELYLIGILGMIALGFAGIEAGTGSAVAYIKTLIGKALKLVAISLVWIITKEISVSVVGSPPSFAEAATVILVQVLTIMLIIQLPPSIEQLAGGISSNMGAQAGSTAASMGTKGAIMATGIGGAFVAGAAVGGATAGTAGAAAGTGAAGTIMGGLKGAGAGALKGGASSAYSMTTTAVQGGARGVQNHAAQKTAQTMANIQQKLAQKFSKGDGSDGSS